MKMTKQGVRDLNNMNKPTAAARALGNDSEPSVPRDVHDLLYCKHDAELGTLIRTSFPAAQMDTADDDIHGPRIEVRIANCALKPWYRFLINEGLHQASLSFQMDCVGGSATGRIGIKVIEEIFDEDKPGWRERMAARQDGGKS